MDTLYEYYYEYYIFTNIFYGVPTLSIYVPIYLAIHTGTVHISVLHG